MNRYQRARALLAFATISLVVAACAPAAGRGIVAYEAAPDELIGEIAAFGVSLRPPGSAYNFYSITSIGDRFVTLQAETTAGFTFFVGGGRVSLTFSATVADGVTRLASSAAGDRGAGNESIDEIIRHLDAKFRRVPIM
ncbi:MAG: hypothetical protein P1P87_00245 [Trueperaceae bacterium]|nr:hypothetical protein [Trueperaceae bacterium]